MLKHFLTLNCLINQNSSIQFIHICHSTGITIESGIYDINGLIGTHLWAFVMVSMHKEELFFIETLTLKASPLHNKLQLKSKTKISLLSPYHPLLQP